MSGSQGPRRLRRSARTEGGRRGAEPRPQRCACALESDGVCGRFCVIRVARPRPQLESSQRGPPAARGTPGRQGDPRPPGGAGESPRVRWTEARATEDFKLHVTRRHLRFAPPRPSETQNSGLALTGLTQATVMLPLR
ncbi:unnamed protein product [Arctogadus glacialis]